MENRKIRTAAVIVALGVEAASALWGAGCRANDALQFTEPTGGYTKKQIILAGEEAGIERGRQFGDAFGVVLGVNFSSLAISAPSGTLQQKTSSVTEFLGGVTKDWWLGGAWSLETDLIYDSYGFSEESGFSISMHYVEIPVQAKYWMRLGQWLPFATLGPQLGIWAGASSKPNALPNAAALFSAVNFAAVFGLGVEHAFVGNTGISLQLRYALGLTNTYRASAGPPGYSQETRGFELVLGVTF